MKASEAPKKIYIPRLISDGKLIHEWNNVPFKKFRYFFDKEIAENIEYIRTDAFIEKALKWYCLDYECNDNCNADYKCFFKQEYKRYLEGNNNAIPPKFDNAINPDGSVTENYRYRHFIRKVQDAFIEKAEKYLTEKFINDISVLAGGVVSINFDAAISNFVKYMKGE